MLLLLLFLLLLLLLPLLRIERTCCGSRVVVTYSPRLPNNPSDTLQREKKSESARLEFFNFSGNIINPPPQDNDFLLMEIPSEP